MRWSGRRIDDTVLAVGFPMSLLIAVWSRHSHHTTFTRAVYPGKLRLQRIGAPHENLAGGTDIPSRMQFGFQCTNTHYRWVNCLSSIRRLTCGGVQAIRRRLVESNYGLELCRSRFTALRCSGGIPRAMRKFTTEIALRRRCHVRSQFDGCCLARRLDRSACRYGSSGLCRIRRSGRSGTESGIPSPPSREPA